MSPRLSGFILIFISATSFGTLALFSRYAYADGMNAPTILFLRFTFAALLMGGGLLARRESLPRGPILWQLVGMGAVGYALQSLSYLSALQYASAGLVALLLYLYPVLVALWAALFLRERLTRPKMFALALALVGTALTVGPLSGQGLGIALALAAAVAYSIYIVVGSQLMKQASAMQSSTVIFASAGVSFGLLTWAQGPQWPQSLNGWAALAGLVVVATIIPVVTFLAGLARVGPTNASTISVFEPVVTVVLAAIFLGETIPLIALFGGALILLAAWLLARSEIKQTAKDA